MKHLLLTIAISLSLVAYGQDCCIKVQNVKSAGYKLKKSANQQIGAIVVGVIGGVGVLINPVIGIVGGGVATVLSIMSIVNKSKAGELLIGADTNTKTPKSNKIKKEVSSDSLKGFKIGDKVKFPFGVKSAIGVIERFDKSMVIIKHKDKKGVVV